ncbi:MAG: hypothetical protein ACR2PI_18670 [Hyphomicrobiaceae bacterium]
MTYGIRAGRLFRLAALAVLASTTVSAHATGIYPDKVLNREAPRLKRAISGIFNKGIKPTFTAQEAAALRGVRLTFPPPRPDDAVLNFYAGQLNGRATVVLPLQSLKLVEDLTTAFAWLYVSKRTFGPLDLYFAMLQRKPHEALGPVGRRDVLSLLGAPANVLKNKKIDDLSLRLRNEAFAYILTHELGHLLFKHKGLAGITPAQARADEIQSDAFAFDVLARSGTPPMGAVLYYQAQIFSLPHRGAFTTQEAWQRYLDTASTHPLSVDRIQAMSRMISGPLAARRTTEHAIWVDIGRRLQMISAILADVELHNCMTRVAKQARVTLLRRTGEAEHRAMKRWCRAS